MQSRGAGWPGITGWPDVSGRRFGSGERGFASQALDGAADSAHQACDRQPQAAQAAGFPARSGHRNARHAGAAWRYQEQQPEVHTYIRSMTRRENRCRRNIALALPSSEKKCGRSPHAVVQVIRTVCKDPLDADGDDHSRTDCRSVMTVSHMTSTHRQPHRRTVEQPRLRGRRDGGTGVGCFCIHTSWTDRQLLQSR